MITYNSTTGVFSYARNPLILTSHFYSSTLFSNGDGTFDAATVPIPGVGLSASSILSGFLTPVSPPIDVVEVYVNFSNASGATRARAEAFHRSNGGSWEHWVAADTGSPAYTQDASRYLCTSISNLVTSTWTYGASATGAVKIDSLSINLDVDKVAALFPELLVGSPVHISIVVYSYKTPCTVIIGSTPVIVDGGGEAVAWINGAISALPAPSPDVPTSLMTQDCLADSSAMTQDCPDEPDPSTMDNEDIL